MPLIIAAYPGIARPVVALVNAFRELRSRISIFVNLPLEFPVSLQMQEHLDQMGRSEMAIAAED